MERLSCCSDLVRREGGSLPVSDCAGDFLIDPEIWEKSRGEMALRIARTVSGYLAQDPAYTEKMVDFELIAYLTE